MKPRQLSFLPRPPREHGGDFRKGKRKTRRPFDPKTPIHLTLSATGARGARSLLRENHKWRVLELMERVAKRRQVRVYRYANVGNHLHLLVQARKRENFQAFLREFAGGVAVIATGAIKTRPEKFWDGLAWSKVVTWGRQFENAARYILLNVMEAAGFRDRALLARLETEGMVLIGDIPES